MNRQYEMTESESDGNEDYTPSESETRPYARDTSSRHGARPEAVSRPRRAAPVPATDVARGRIRLNTNKPSGLRNQVVTEDESDDPNSTVELASSSRASLTRGSKTKRRVIVDEESESEDEDEDDEEAVDRDEDDDDDMDEESDAEADGDEDTDMPEATEALPKLHATIKLNPITTRKPSPQHTLKLAPKVQSVEEKEIRMARKGTSDDEELSSVEDSEEMDDDDMSDDEGGPADSAALDTIRASAIGDDELDSSSDDLDDSRDGTPDPTKQTRRQRAENDSLMALSNEAQKKKFFTAEQITMRRAEMARRRKDLSEKRNEQEKLDTLDRLLHKRAPVRRTRAQMMADAEREEFGTPGGDDEHVVRARPGYVRTILGYATTRVGVPEEWKGKDAGRIFEGAKTHDDALKTVSGSRMVQVVE